MKCENHLLLIIRHMLDIIDFIPAVAVPSYFQYMTHGWIEESYFKYFPYLPRNHKTSLLFLKPVKVLQARKLGIDCDLKWNKYHVSDYLAFLCQFSETPCSTFYFSFTLE